MVITITSRSTKAEIERALRKLEGQGKKRRRKSKKTFNALNYCGIIRLKKDPLQLQKQWRNEWE